MWNARMDEAQVGIKIARRNVNNLRYVDDTTLMAKSEEELKKLFLKVKEECEKAGFKLNIQKHGIQSHHFMAKWWGNNGNSERLYFWGLQNHCRWWMQPWNSKMLAPWKKSFANITFPTMVHLVKAMVFPVVMYRCESWTIKKAEHQRIDGFELWCWKDSWESLGLQRDQTSQS